VSPRRVSARGYNPRMLRPTAAAALAGVRAALRARWRLALGAAAGVVALDVVVPPLVLSLARKPVDFFTVNPWLSQLGGYLRSGPGSLGERLGKTWDLALFWCSADSPYGGVEWGFAVTVADLARFGASGLLIGLYFALWAYRRDRLARAGWGARAGAQGGAAGAALGVLGVAGGGCTVMGCGAPVIPVVGLAFAGLSSTTLKWMAQASTIATAAALVGLGLGAVCFAASVGRSLSAGIARRR
jgi:hypothetical protein